MEGGEIIYCKVKYFGKEWLQEMQNLGVLSLENSFFLNISLKVLRDMSAASLGFSWQ